ncbi:MAG: dihydropteroate synthase [Crocinitomicaceae bacterium]
MGVLNVNYDSFYSHSRIAGKKEFLPRIERMIEDGMSILDLGAYSSRPGAEFVSELEERRRLEGVLTEIVYHFPELTISIDTFRSEIARFAIGEGASLINDISGGSLDERMFETIADLNVPYVLMHMKGTPQSMREMTDYKDILKEIYQYFDKKLNHLEEIGVEDVILDLGYGFAKTLDQNYFLLNHQNYFESLNRPILTGISRKSMIYKLLDSTPEQALNGTSVLNFKALENGANILRVHDVREAKEVIKIFEKLRTER